MIIGNRIYVSRSIDSCNRNLERTSKTLFSVQTFGKNGVAKSGNKEGAKAVGAKVAEGLKGKGLSAAVLDRSGHQYAGVLGALTDSIRENGIRI